VEFDNRETIPQISMNAMNENTGFYTIRINGDMGKRTIDSGNTHNFLDETPAKVRM